MLIESHVKAAGWVQQGTVGERDEHAGHFLADVYAHPQHPGMVLRLYQPAKNKGLENEGRWDTDNEDWMLYVDSTHVDGGTNISTLKLALPKLGAK